MSVLLCGKRSPASFFEDDCHTPSPASKRIRCSSALHFSPHNPLVSSPPVVVSPIDHLRSLFPDMDQELLEKALEVSGNDLDIAIKNLNDLHLVSSREEVDLANNNKASIGTEASVWQSPEGSVNHTGENNIFPNQSAACNLPSSGSEWVELIVREMSTAANIDDARARASRVLEGLEKSIVTRACAEAAQSFQKENVMLKEQVEKLLQENDIWKRGFKTLHGQKEEFERCSQELQQLKQMISQRDEQLTKLQIENYELRLRLMREQQSSPIPGRFHPDIFG
ncbi:uncharacterized protein A4U43_C05F32730 [Asparagus officinalis]|uniref:CUE domain-containing protein n=1 Tax=Asparagus officinalis TaxID=4686 RepID=A0A5P1F0U9_ASPOF|nr:uncharacterized protein LOC109841140 [Asparagus officinalis]ONK70341.1 uncharacterized protein A4U43_C05F32730 [Asparagus officinalis]